MIRFLQFQPQGELKCSWSGFYDDESTLKQYSFALGTEEGLSDLIPNFVVAANKTWFHTDGIVFVEYTNIYSNKHLRLKD